MSVATRLGLRLIGAGVVLGLLADVLLRVTPLGLNVLLFAVAFAAFVVFFAWGRLGPRRWLLVPFLLFAACLCWRDSPWLAALDVFAMIVAVAVAAARVTEPAHAGLGDYATGLAAVTTGAVGGGAVLIGEEIGWSELPRGGRGGQVEAVGRGLALATPLLLVFGALFVAADAVFRGIVTSLVPSDLSTPVVHLLVIGAGGWVSLGLLRQLRLPATEELARLEPVQRFLRIGAIEISVLFGLLDLLFLAFVLVQFRAFFGGKDFVRAHAHVTYASYARRGFFELVIVAALVLPLLLLVDWVLRRERPEHERIFRALAGILVALLFVIMGSALERMRLYQREYGLTELRVYATGFMLWLAAVFLWACATVLRGRRRLFAVGALASGFAAILAVNALNPDALITRTNLHRPHLDAAYLAGLSDDAVPTFARELPGIAPRLRRQIASELVRRDRHPDWRTWNWSRARARSLRGALERDL